MHYRPFSAGPSVFTVLVMGVSWLLLAAIALSDESTTEERRENKPGATRQDWMTRGHETSVIAQLNRLIKQNVQQEPGPPEAIPGLASAVYLGSGMALVLWDGYSNPTAEAQEMTMLSGSGNPGYIMVPPGKKIDPDMMFEACSITKTFTAATVLFFQEIGSIDINDRVKQWLPATKRLPGLNCCHQKGDYCVGDSETCPTIKDLLGMTSGIQDFTDGVWEPFLPEKTKPGFFHQRTQIHNPNKFWLPPFVYANLLSYQPANLPGKSFLYSSTNYVLLGEICLDLANFFNLTGVYQEVAAKVDLTDTYLGGYQTIVGGKRALGWNGIQAAHARRAFLTAYWAAGGLIATAEDLAKWIYELHQPGVVLTEPSLKQMHDFYVFDPPLPVYKDVEGFYIKGYGLGMTWFIVTMAAGQSPAKAAQKGDLINLYGHSGGSWAFLSFAFYDPDRKLSYGLMINKKSPAEFTAFTRDYVRIVAKHLPPWVLPDPWRPPPFKDQP